MVNKKIYYLIILIIISNFINLNECKKNNKSNNLQDVENSSDTNDTDNNELFYFVDIYNGQDSYDGSKEKPFKNLEFSINYIKNLKNQEKKKISVIVSKGVYKFESTLIIDGIQPLSIYGDYNGYPEWKRNNFTSLTYQSETIIESDDPNAIQIINSLNTNITISHLLIKTGSPRIITTVPISIYKQLVEDTTSSYGILISNCNNIKLKFLTIISSDATNGYSPYPYKVDRRFEGQDGKYGSVGCEDGQYSECSTCKAPKHGNGGEPITKCLNQYSDDISYGGNGGKPGKGNHEGNYGKNATNNGGLGGKGTKSSFMYLDPYSNGEDGENGINGLNGNLTVFGFREYGIVSLKNIPSDGHNGRGGGGGGGAGGTMKGRCQVYGGSGGGGGSGGCGGRAAKSGGSGGSSIGVYIYNPGNLISIEFCNIKTGNAGNGGKPSTPELGYKGGQGGKSIRNKQFPQGGFGGDGGKGGNGGQASGGQGGFSISLLISGDNKKTTFSIPLIKCNKFVYGIKGKGGLSDFHELNGIDGIESKCYSTISHSDFKCPDYSTKDYLLNLVTPEYQNCEFGETKDQFGICGGNNSLSINLLGCDGKINSGLKYDICGKCGGNNSTCIIGCDGIVNSTKVYDICGVCGGSNSTCLIGCDGVINSGLEFDLCGVCNGYNSTCLIGCDGIVNSTKEYDTCGVCGGNNSTCLIGCDGVEHSYKEFDKCGVCGGDSTSCISKKNIKKMKTSTKVVVCGVIICISIYGGLMGLYFYKKKIATKGSQYYRTKLILEYQDSPIIQAELIKPHYYDTDQSQPPNGNNPNYPQSPNNLNIWPSSPYPNSTHISGGGAGGVNFLNTFSPRRNNNYMRFNNNEDIYDSDEDNNNPNQIQLDTLNTSTSNISYPIINSNLNDINNNDNNNDNNNYNNNQYENYNNDLNNSHISYISNYNEEDESSSSSSNDNLSYISHINR